MPVDQGLDSEVIPFRVTIGEDDCGHEQDQLVHLPQDLHRVLSKDGIVRRQFHAVTVGLSDQQSIKRIAMDHRQAMNLANLWFIDQQ